MSRGITINERNSGNDAAVLLDEIGTNDIVERVIAPFHEEVGANVVDELLGGVLIENDDEIDTGEGSQEKGAVVLGIHGAGRTFQAADRAVGVESDDKQVAEVAGLGEIDGVPAVEDVKASVSKYDTAVCRRIPLLSRDNLSFYFIKNHNVAKIMPCVSQMTSR